MFQHILIPTDGSKLSEKVARKGLRFARAIGARTPLTCCSVALASASWPA